MIQAAKATAKQCNKCGVSKPFSRFPHDKTYKSGVRGICKSCVNEAFKANYRKKDGIRAKALISRSD